MNDEMLKEAVLYFRGDTGYDTLFSLFLQKYRSIGRVGGSVVIKDATLEEKRAISGFLGIDGYREKHLKVPLRSFEKELQRSKFGGIAFIDLLEAYFKRSIVSRQEENDQLQEAEQLFFASFAEHTESRSAATYLAGVQNRAPGTSPARLLYQRDPLYATEVIAYTLAALNRLPLESAERLPLFASLVTKDPHYFDPDTEGGKLLINALSYVLANNGEEVPNPMNSEQLTELYDCFGLARDDVNNYVSVFGLTGTGVDGRTDALLAVAARDGRVLNLPLREVKALESVTAENDAIFIVENSGLFSSLVDRVLEERLPVSLVCANGQVRLSTLELLKRSGEATLYYAGDYDPEGVLIAARLRERFGDRLQFWRYAVADYESARSKKPIEDRRLKQLAALSEPELEPLAAALQIHQQAGYQEEQFDNLLADLRAFVEAAADPAFGR